jgi:2,5-diamino-6-(ribosylamino)-4(3H)-pyrimidinone 5'-phosphate reductase
VIDRFWRLACWKHWANLPDYYSEVLVAVHPQFIAYQNFLTEKGIPWIEFLQFKDFFDQLYSLGHRTIQIDAGGELNQALLSRELVDEISLLIHPEIVGGGYTEFLLGTLPIKGIKLNPLQEPQIHGDKIHLRYAVGY